MHGSLCVRRCAGPPLPPGNYRCRSGCMAALEAEKYLEEHGLGSPKRERDDSAGGTPGAAGRNHAMSPRWPRWPRRRAHGGIENLSRSDHCRSGWALAPALPENRVQEFAAKAPALASSAPTAPWPLPMCRSRSTSSAICNPTRQRARWSSSDAMSSTLSAWPSVSTRQRANSANGCLSSKSNYEETKEGYLILVPAEAGELLERLPDFPISRPARAHDDCPLGRARRRDARLLPQLCTVSATAGLHRTRD